MPSEPYDRRTCPTLRRGARGDAVVKMQKRLVEHLGDLDADTFVDGEFGPATEQQVKRFQKDKRLTVDGVVGRDSWNSLLAEPGVPVRSPVGETAKTEDRQQAADQNSPRNGGGALADRVMRALRRKGYMFLDDGKAYHLNIVGVRNPSTTIDSFDDRVVLVYRDETGVQQAVEYAITTDPGEYYTKTELLNKDGAAILVPGQYRNVYKIDKHNGKYEALTQRGGTVKVWRDGNRDDQLNRSGTIHEGWYGINIHRGNSTGRTERVGRYSAGCQVFQNADEFGVLISLAKKSRDVRVDSFTYTLLEEADLS
jgi:peptidoglycan hydrolase-like protein with peptidoglycan-binding domain